MVKFKTIAEQFAERGVNTLTKEQIRVLTSPEVYRELCDVVERAFLGWDVSTHIDDSQRHTSDYAREGANRIIEIILDNV